MSRVLGVLLLAAAVLSPSCSRKPESCDVCRRETCLGIRFEVEFRHGGRKKLCCPRCASHVVAQAGGMGNVTRLTAHDFETGGRLDALSALYLDGSDVRHCKIQPPERGRTEDGCCTVLEMDRCQPSLLAFRTREAAEAVARNHGGVVQTFDELRFGER